MSDQITTIATLLKQANVFVKERDWDQFHTIKNLSMNLSIEAAELMELFVWYTDEGASKELVKRRSEVEDEVSDIFLMLLLFCNKTSIDLSTAFEHKLAKTAAKYPVDKCKGKPLKYNQL